MLRVVLDANVVISGTISSRGPSGSILDAWLADKFELVVCAELVKEIKEKLNLPRIRKKYPLSGKKIGDLLVRIKKAAFSVSAAAQVDPEPPDADDTMLFAAAIEANADYIVTGDKPILAFSWPGPGKIVSPRVFWENVFAIVTDNATGTLYFPFEFENASFAASWNPLLTSAAYPGPRCPAARPRSCGRHVLFPQRSPCSLGDSRTG